MTLEDAQKLLSSYSLSELLEFSECDEAEALVLLYQQGYLADLPEELKPL